MAPDVLLKFVDDLAPIIALIIALLTLSSQVAKLTIWIGNILAKKSLRRRYDAILIRPTIEEIAKFSIQNSHKSETQSDYEANLTDRAAVHSSNSARDLNTLRILTLAYCFLSAFLTIAVKFLYIAYTN